MQEFHDIEALAERLTKLEEKVALAKREFTGIVQSENHHDAIRRAAEAIRALEKL